MARLAPTPEARNQVAAGVPLRRLGEPGDVADACLFLGSDAARYVSGGPPAGRRRLDPERRADGAGGVTAGQSRQGLNPGTGVALRRRKARSYGVSAQFCIARRIASVVVALPCSIWPIALLFNFEEKWCTIKARD